jgi:hypothetical protein
VPSRSVIWVLQQDQNPKQDRHFRASTARVARPDHIDGATPGLDRQTAVHLHGKGSKQPTRHSALEEHATELRSWLHRINSAPDAPVFRNRPA